VHQLLLMHLVFTHIYSKYVKYENVSNARNFVELCNRQRKVSDATVIFCPNTECISNLTAKHNQSDVISI
jgi:hypothetical protein